MKEGRKKYSTEEELEIYKKMYEKLELKYNKIHRLLFYSIHNEWVKKMIQDSNLITYGRKNCSESEVEELISYLKKGE